MRLGSPRLRLRTSGAARYMPLNMEERGDAQRADAQPPEGAATGGEDGRPSAHSEDRRRVPVWGWALMGLVLAAIVGTAIGISLGTRQGGPLATQTATGGRPTIVVATSPAASPSVSAVPSPSPLIAQSPVVAQQGARQYVVQPGDTLRSIAQ